MKLKFTLLLTMVFTMVQAQVCLTEDSPQAPMANSQTSTCDTITDYIPGPTDDLITVRVSFVVVQNDNGVSRAFHDNYAADEADIKSSIVNWTSSIYSNLSAPTVPPNPNVNHLTDTRIRLKFDTLIYVKSDTLSPSNNRYDYYDLYDNHVP